MTSLSTSKYIKQSSKIQLFIRIVHYCLRGPTEDYTTRATNVERPLRSFSHTLQLLRHFPCSQMRLPPHFLYRRRRRPCSRMLPPPHCLHSLRRRPCFDTAQIAFVVSANVQLLITTGTSLVDSSFDFGPPSLLQSRSAWHVSRPWAHRPQIVR